MTYTVTGDPDYPRTAKVSLDVPASEGESPHLYVERSAKNWTLFGLFVPPALRGKGYGSTLMQVAIRLCEEKAPELAIFLEARPFGKEAPSAAYLRQFYHQFGFECWPGHPQSMVRWPKDSDHTVEDPCLLPADIYSSAKRLVGLAEQMRTSLRQLRECTRTCEPAKAPLCDAWTAMLGIAGESASIQQLIKVGRLAAIGVVQADHVLPEKLELHPRNLPEQTQLKLDAKMRQANDHTLEDDTDG